MTGYLLQKEMRFTVFPHMAWNPEGESGACTLGLRLLISGPWLLLSLCPTVLRNLCLSHGPRVAPAPLLSGPHSRQQRREGGCQQLFQLLSLKTIVPGACSGSCASLSLARLCYMTILDAREMGKNLLMLSTKSDFL